MAKRKPPPTLEELKSMSWAEYIKSTYWRNFSKKLLSDPDCYCEVCFRKRWNFYKVGTRKGNKRKRPRLRFNVHHKVYRKGEETRNDVLILCQRCHDLIHSIYTAANSEIDTNLYKEIYQYMLENTVWEYTPHKN